MKFNIEINILFLGQICRNPVFVRPTRGRSDLELSVGEVSSGDSKPSGEELPRLLPARVRHGQREQTTIRNRRTGLLQLPQRSRMLQSIHLNHLKIQFFFF